MLRTFKNQPITRSFICAWALICLFGLEQAWAQSLDALNFEEQKYRFSGFGTLGATHSGDNTLGYRRDVAQEGQYDGHWSLEPDTILGLQLDAKFTKNLSGAIQVVARERVSHEYDDMVEWAYLKYQFNPAFAVRAGRFGLDLFMLSEYRNVGIAYLWARPPIEFYGSISFSHVDGLDVTFQQPLGDGTLEVKVFGGRSESTFGYRGNQVEYILSPTYGITIGWESTHWRFKLVYEDLDFGDKMNKEFGAEELIMFLGQAQDSIDGTPISWPQIDQITNELDVTGTGIHYHSLGIAYDNAPWIIQAETALITSGYDLYQDFYNSYLSVGYRIGPTTVYGMGALAENHDDRELVPEPTIVPPAGFELLPLLQQQATMAALQAQLASIMPLHAGVQSNYDAAKIDQKTFSLGMRWDIRYDIALKVQLDRTHVQAYGSALWDPKATQSKDKVLDTYSINLNFVF